jgi:hypothetical protein
MARPKGSKNKPKAPLVEQFSFTTEQRIRLVANLIVEKIIEDGAFAKKLITILEDEKNVSK